MRRRLQQLAAAAAALHSPGGTGRWRPGVPSNEPPLHATFPVTLVCGRPLGSSRRFDKIPINCLTKCWNQTAHDKIPQNDDPFPNVKPVSACVAALLRAAAAAGSARLGCPHPKQAQPASLHIEVGCASPAGPLCPCCAACWRPGPRRAGGTAQRTPPGHSPLRPPAGKGRGRRQGGAGGSRAAASGGTRLTDSRQAL